MDLGTECENIIKKSHGATRKNPGIYLVKKIFLQNRISLKIRLFKRCSGYFFSDRFLNTYGIL